MTTNAPSIQWLKYSVSCFLSFSHCPSELPSIPSIVALPCPILSSSHCVCMKKLVPLLGQGAGMPAWKAPGRNAFWTPLVPLVWCSESLRCWGLCQALQEVHYFRPFQRQCLSVPPSLKIPSSFECYYPVLSMRRARRELSVPGCVLFVIRDDHHASFNSAVSQQTPRKGSWQRLERRIRDEHAHNQERKINKHLVITL